MPRKATYDVALEEDGVYYLWGRVLAPNSTTDSFYVAIDGQRFEYHAAAGMSWSPQWKWTVLTIGPEDENAKSVPRELSLSAGTHTIVLTSREAGSSLDRFLFTDDLAFTPP